MARFFIERPVFAIVIAIVICLMGLVAIPNLPIATYPEVVPPVIQITATYLGGNATDLEKTVAQPIEEQLYGLDGMLYYLSTSANNGALIINVTFKLGTNPDIATVQTQNRVAVALPRLPPEVQKQGVVVKKVSSAFVMAVALVSDDKRYDSLFLNDYAQINLVNQLGSLPGVGDSRLAIPLIYSMRVWVNPDKMAKLQLTATDISNAIAAQNKQNPAGAVGQPPSPTGTDFQYPVAAPGRLTDASQFDDIVLRSQPDASLLRIRDIGHTELGAQSYGGFTRLNGEPSSNTILYLAPGANAVATAKLIRDYMEGIKGTFPKGVRYVIPYDATMFVRAAIADVLQTLFEAIGLVLIVVFVFLQNWRSTLIPLLTVPVAVLGTIALFPILGFSINITSMFGLVLAIGIVVDDAIVVVEAVQRHIDDGMSPHDATVQAMKEVSAPVVAIAFILAAVFVPVAFLGGISGQIYRQFALTIAVSVLISAFNALSLSPALSAMLLRDKTVKKNFFMRALDRYGFDRFNAAFNWVNARYISGVKVLIRHSVFALLGLLAFWVVTGGLFKTLPTGFLPDEDQGAFFTGIRLPDGASTDRASAASDKVEKIIGQLPGVDKYFVLGGLDIATQTSNSNVATIIATLKPFDDRHSKEMQLGPILGRATAAFSQVPEAFTFAFGLPPILGLSTTGGFQFMLEDRAGGDVESLARNADALVNAARQRKELANVISTFRADVPAYQLNMNTDKLQTFGIPVPDAYNALQTFLGGLYVNDFNLFGHTWQVLIQAEDRYRSKPSDIDRFYVRTNDNNMVPLGTLASVTPSSGPDVIYRYNRFRSVQILGGPAPGYSSGDATKAMEEVAANLPSGYGWEWTGTTYQEKQAEGHEGIIFGFAAVLVFLFLAALYESWSVPFAVLFALPLGLFGALLAVYLRHYSYDIYTQIGIVTLIGLAAKNAILIVEFAKVAHDEEGKSVLDAAIEAARLRLRPILMTSFAFILGVLPLFLAIGASAASRRSLGTTVFGGMLAATLLAVFIVPVLFVVIEGLAERGTALRLSTALPLLLLLFTLTSCTVGPNYQRPTVPVPDQFRGPQTASTNSIAETKFADLFHDDALTALLNKSLQNNFDVRASAERILEARAQVGIARANQFPFIDANASFTTTKSSALGPFPFPPGTQLTSSYTQAGASLSWEADIWGRYRRLTEAARAQYAATEEARRGVIVSLVGDVMTSYFTLLEQDLELDIANHTRDVGNDNLRLVNLRHDRGAVTALDVHQAEQLLYTATAQIEAVKRNIGQTEDALSLLLAETPHDIVRDRKLDDLALPGELPAGIPSSLITRRPDILQAEDMLKTANAQIGAARALYFPNITLTASAGGQSQPLLRLLSSKAGVFSVAPSALQPIFHAGQIKNQVRLSEAQQREALIEYQKSIYGALREVSDALIGHDRLRAQRGEEEKLVKALDESVRLSNLRYKGGLDSYLQVLDAERNLFSGQLVLSQLRLQELLSIVNLYRALGGGWS